MKVCCDLGELWFGLAQFLVQARLYETVVFWGRSARAALEFAMELRREEEVFAGQLERFHSSAVCALAREA